MTISDGFTPDRDPLRQELSRVGLKFNTTVPRAVCAEGFRQLLMAGRIVDGRAGGIVLGKGMDEGGVRTVFKIGSDYLIEGFVEGGCYLINKEATVLHQARLQAMNSGITGRETVPADPDVQLGQLVVTTAYPHDRLLWIDWMQMVVCVPAALKHMTELNEMNRQPNPYLKCDHYEVFNCEPGTPDGIV